MMEDSLLLLLLLGCEDGFVSIRTCCSTMSSSSLLLLLRRDQHSNAEAIDLESENECVCVRDLGRMCGGEEEEEGGGGWLWKRWLFQISEFGHVFLC